MLSYADAFTSCNCNLYNATQCFCLKLEVSAVKGLTLSISRYTVYIQFIYDPVKRNCYLLIIHRAVSLKRELN